MIERNYGSIWYPAAKNQQIKLKAGYLNTKEREYDTKIPLPAGG